MEREKTNSITHLVKIVAEEVFDGVHHNIFERLDELEGQVENLKNKDTWEMNQITSNIIRDVKSSLDEAGSSWSEKEHELLRCELRTALAVIAKNHHRTKGAIRARINQHKMI